MSLAIAKLLESVMPGTKVTRAPAMFGCDAVLTRNKQIVSYVNGYTIVQPKEDWKEITLLKCELELWDRANRMFINENKPLTPLSLVAKMKDGIYAMRVSASWKSEYRETLAGDAAGQTKIRIPTKGFVKLKTTD